MKELFVPYDLSIKLRELGFDELCFKTWLKANELRHAESKNSGLNKYLCSAPTWNQAFDWVEKEYRLYAMIYPRYGYNYMISSLDDGGNCSENSHHGEGFKSGREARQKCIEKLLELVAS